MGNACPFQSRVEAYHDGELADATTRSALERHLAGCATCADDLAFLRRVSATLARADAGGTLSPAALDRVHGAIDAEADAADAADAARFDLRRLYRAAGALSAVAASILVLSCTWLTTLSAPPGVGSRSSANPQVVLAPTDAWERVALTLRADPGRAGGPDGAGGGVYLADAGDADSLADWMLHGLGPAAAAVGAEATR